MQKTIGLLLLLLSGVVQAGDARCVAPGVTFEVNGNLVKFFYATSSISNPDLANGYTLTCVHHLGKFSQSKKNNEYVLSFNEPKDQYGESERCKVHIFETGSNFRIYTTECVSECMKFDHQFEMVGNSCRNTKATPNNSLQPTSALTRRRG